MKNEFNTRDVFFYEYGLDFHEPNYLAELKNDVFYYMLDILLPEINNRFDQRSLDIITEMQTFTHENLLKENTSIRVSCLCKNYNIDASSVENELKEFRKIYKAVKKTIDVSDIIKNDVKAFNYSDREDEQEGSNNNAQESDDDSFKKMSFSFLVKGFIKPFRLLVQLQVQITITFFLFMKFY